MIPQRSWPSQVTAFGMGGGFSPPSHLSPLSGQKRCRSRPPRAPATCGTELSRQQQPFCRSDAEGSRWTPAGDLCGDEPSAGSLKQAEQCWQKLLGEHGCLGRH